MDILNVNCVVSAPALLKYAGTLLLLVSMLMVMLLIHCFCVLCFYGGRFRERRPSLIAAAGTTVMALLISLVSSIVAPLQCELHPNGYSTVQAYDQILCWSGDHGNGDKHLHMVVIALFLSGIPVSFIAVCSWVVVQLPGRMRQGDTTFLHAFAFLFFRFKPEAFWYVLVVLFRNLTVALAPVLLDVTTQFFLLLLALGLPIVTCAAVFPWRISTANILDLATNSGFVLILFFGALLADAANEALVAGILTVIVCVLCFLFLMGLLRSLYCTLLLRGRTYQHFLCHHKQGGGGFARLLKIRLKRDPRVKRQVFLDSDNLQDLDQLFGIVGNLTDSLVVLCTSSILLRPWCVGEMTTAKLHGVDSILLIFPDFRWPTDEFVENYAQHVEGILSLAQYGINVGLAQEALRWLRTQPSIHLPQKLSLATMDAVAGKLVSRQQGRYEFSGHRGIETRSVSHELATADTISGSVATLHAEHYVQDLVDPIAMPTCRVAAIVDMADREAVCAALLLEEDARAPSCEMRGNRCLSSFLKMVMFPPMSMWC